MAQPIMALDWHFQPGVDAPADEWCDRDRGIGKNGPIKAKEARPAWEQELASATGWHWLSPRITTGPEDMIEEDRPAVRQANEALYSGMAAQQSLPMGMSEQLPGAFQAIPLGLDFGVRYHF